MLEPGAAGTLAQSRWPDRALVPQFWVSPQAPEGPGRARVQRLIELVKSAILCTVVSGYLALEGKTPHDGWVIGVS